MLYQRWQSPADLEEHKISTVLGRLKDRGYYFKYSGGWGNWPDTYLHNCVAHYYAIELLQSRWAAESKRGGKVSSARERIATAFTQKELIELKKEADEMSNLYDTWGS